MGIVRLRKGKSTGHCEAKALSDKEIGGFAAHEMTVPDGAARQAYLPVTGTRRSRLSTMGVVSNCAFNFAALWLASFNPR